jgi:hypothetical protein
MEKPMSIFKGSMQKMMRKGDLPLLCLVFLLLLPLALTSLAYAVPETNAVRVTDVTASSFSLVWMTDSAAEPTVEVFSDRSLQQRVTEGLVVTPMPGESAAVQAARTKGIMKARVSGALPSTTYYARAVTKDPANPDSVSYSTLQEVTTASTVLLYRTVNSAAQALANDLVAVPVYVRPADQADQPRLGDLIMLEGQGTPYPISAFVGDGAVSPEGILDLNNLFGIDGSSLAVAGGERIIIRIYRADNLSTLTHYRRVPQNSGAVSVAGPVKGHFADINLDGSVDTADFSSFKEQYRTLPNDATYNPDYDFVNDPEGSVDVREFGKFSKEFGRTDVH